MARIREEGKKERKKRKRKKKKKKRKKKTNSRLERKKGRRGDTTPARAGPCPDVCCFSFLSSESV